VSATVDAATHSLADHHPIGISAGVFADSRGNWPALVDQACKVSAFVVELSALSGNELPGLLSYLRAKPRLPFRYVSVHTPVKQLDLDESACVRQLDGLPLWVRSIVAHPDALSEPEAYRALGTRLVLENMDDRKATGRVADEMETFFEALPDAGFCFDIAHAHSIDPSMDVAKELLDRFRSRLRHVHLSSLSGGHRVPVAADHESLFMEVLDRCRDVPWILEAPPPESWTERLARRNWWRQARRRSATAGDLRPRSRRPRGGGGPRRTRSGPCAHGEGAPTMMRRMLAEVQDHNTSGCDLPLSMRRSGRLMRQTWRTSGEWCDCLDESAEQRV